MSRMTNLGLELYLNDLKPEIQEEFRRYVKDDPDEFNIHPFATIYVQTQEEQEEAIANSPFI